MFSNPTYGLAEVPETMKYLPTLRGSTSSNHFGLSVYVKDCIHNFLEHIFFCVYAVNSKIIRALVIILAVFLSFDCQFLSSHACYKQQKA